MARLNWSVKPYKSIHIFELETIKWTPPPIFKIRKTFTLSDSSKVLGSGRVDSTLQKFYEFWIWFSDRRYKFNLNITRTRLYITYFVTILRFFIPRNFKFFKVNRTVDKKRTNTDRHQTDRQTDRKKDVFFVRLYEHSMNHS